MTGLLNSLFLLPKGLLLPAHAAAMTIDGAPVIVKNNSASVDVQTTFRDEKPAFMGNAVRPFLALLRAYPQVRFVNISWEDSNELGYNGAHVLYDRVKHTVTVASFDGFNDGNPFGGEVRFTSVRESVFQAILKAHPQLSPYRDPEAEEIAKAHGDNTDWDGFEFLYQHRYGCRSRVIKARHALPSSVT